MWKAVTQRFTVMFIPHSENGSFNFKISLLSLIAILLIFSTVILISIFSITENVDSTNEIEKLLEERAEMIRVLSDYQQSVPRLKEVYYELSQSVRKLNEASGDVVRENNINISQFDADEMITKILESDVNQKDEIAQLIQTEYGLEKLIPEINSVAKYLENYKKVFDVIPSINPVIGNPLIVSDYGWRYHPFYKTRKYHYGIDMKESMYTKIRATASGKVVIARYSKTAGNYIELEHEYGFTTRYMHLAKIKVSAGQTIKKGQVIGLLGNTGRSQAPHLHYEVHINNEYVNPSPFLRLGSLLDK